MTRRPLPDSEQYALERGELRRRRMRRVSLWVLLAAGGAVVLYVVAGGELPDTPRWLELLFTT